MGYIMGSEKESKRGKERGMKFLIWCAWALPLFGALCWLAERAVGEDYHEWSFIAGLIVLAVCHMVDDVVEFLTED